MRFTLLTTLLALFALFALATAHIESITGPAKYKPTTNSNYPLTFNTANGPITKCVVLLLSPCCLRKAD
jgi:hypothetical protein